MSTWTSAMVAAKIAVIAPTVPTTCSDGPASSKSGIERATRYTAAVTIVAGWRRAETGGGRAADVVPLRRRVGGGGAAA